MLLKNVLRRLCWKVIKRKLHIRNIKHGKTYKEVRFFTPFGQISGTWWGDRKAKPIIAIHNILENCDSFQELAPLIEAPSILAVDLPGHGFSTALPSGTLLIFQYLAILRQLIGQLNMADVTLIGHGFGSLLALKFSAIYHDIITNCISLECSRHILSNDLSEFDGVFVDHFLELDCFLKSPLTEFDVLEVMLNRFGGNISGKAAKILCDREVEEKNEMFFFKTDPRLFYPSALHYDDDEVLLFADKFKANGLLVRNVIDNELGAATPEEEETPFYSLLSRHSLIRKKGVAVVNNLNNGSLGALMKASPHVYVKDVNVNGHFLLDAPNVIAPVINSFLAKMNSISTKTIAKMTFKKSAS